MRVNRFPRGTFREGLSQTCGSSCSSFSAFLLSSWFPSQTLVFSVYTTAVAYLRHQGDTLSSFFIELAQRIFRQAERVEISTRPRFVPGWNNIVAASWFRFLPFPSRESSGRRNSGSSPQGAVEPAPPSPWFVVLKASGGWRPIIDLSTLISSVVVSEFRMVSAQSVFRSVLGNVCMVAVDLRALTFRFRFILRVKSS